VSEEWPAVRRSQETVAELLDNPDNKEEEAFFIKLDKYYAQAR
jgi:hypothetical protein